MYKGLFATILAAVCAAAVVAFIPPPAPALATVQTAQRQVTQIGLIAAPARDAVVRGRACVQAWPYYEASCLRNSRPQGSSATVVRVIAAANNSASHAQRADR